jgi:hypothetical protein
MAAEELQTYLNDHLAGSVAAVSLLERLIGTSESPAEQEFFRTLKQEIEDDQSTLGSLIQRVGGQESAVRRVGAWITEKFVEVKMRFDDPGGRRLTYLEALETLALGILGKRALWRLLDAVSDDVPDLRGMDFDRLERRAQDQHDRVEARRIEAGRRIFTTVRDETAARPA